MNPEALERLLTEVQKGTLPVKAAIGQLRTLPYEKTLSIEGTLLT